MIVILLPSLETVNFIFKAFLCLFLYGGENTCQWTTSFIPYVMPENSYFFSFAVKSFQLPTSVEKMQRKENNSEHYQEEWTQCGLHNH